jgi:hypothetical protein
MHRTPRTHRSLVVATAAALSICSARTAHAQRTPTRQESAVESLLRRADAAQEATDYATALTLYQQAYTEGHDPVVLFNIGRMHIQLRHWAEGRRALRNFLDAVRETPTRPTCERMIADADRELAAETAQHGQRAEQERIERERRARVVQPPVEAPRPAPAWPWALVGTSAALAVGAGVGAALYAVNSARLFDTSASNCILVGGRLDCPASEEGTYTTASIGGGLMFGLGAGAVALGIAGGVAVAVTRPRAATRTSVAVVPSANGTTLVMGGAF